VLLRTELLPTQAQPMHWPVSQLWTQGGGIAGPHRPPSPPPFAGRSPSTGVILSSEAARVHAALQVTRRPLEDPSKMGVILIAVLVVGVTCDDMLGKCSNRKQCRIL
jgi:hypothetical protein